MPSVNIKDDSCLKTESWPRLVCSGVKGMTEGEKEIEAEKAPLDNSDPTSVGT